MSGQTSDAAERDLAAKGFNRLLVRVPSDRPVSAVVAQARRAARRAKGTTVQLNVSSGPGATTTTTATTTPTTTSSTSTSGVTTTSP